jgi:hypothetical protein
LIRQYFSCNPLDQAMQPIVTIIIPCYQQGHFLADAVTSALSQEEVPLQIVIVNDGSTDNTCEVAEIFQRKYPDVVRLINKPNSGQAHARQTGFDVAKGEFIVMLDADDMLAADMVKQCLWVFDQSPDTDVVVGNARMVHEDGHTVIREHRTSHITPWPKIMEQNPYGALVATMARAESIQKVGGLAIDGRPGCEDWDLWIRMARCAMVFRVLNRFLGKYRRSRSSYSMDPLSMLESALDVIRRNATNDVRMDTLPVSRVTPGVDPKDLARLINLRVFHALGHAVALSRPDDVVERIVSCLQPGRLYRRLYLDAFVLGLHYVRLHEPDSRLFVQPDPAPLVDHLKQRFKDIGWDNHGNSLSKRLVSILKDPRPQRALLTRILARMKNMGSA